METRTHRRIGARDRAVVGFLVATVLALVLPRPATAQPGPIKAPVRAEFSVNGGVLVPATDLIETTTGTTPPLKLAQSFAFGGSVGVLLPAGIGIEAQGLFSPGMEVEDDAGAVVTGGNFTAVTGNLIYRFPVPLIQPFIGAGAGFKSLSFDDATTPLGEDASDFVANVLAGAYVTIVPGWRLRVEARDYLSSFTPASGAESAFQNDFAILGGTSFRFP